MDPNKEETSSCLPADNEIDRQEQQSNLTNLNLSSETLPQTQNSMPETEPNESIELKEVIPSESDSATLSGQLNENEQKSCVEGNTDDEITNKENLNTNESSQETVIVEKEDQNESKHDADNKANVSESVAVLEVSQVQTIHEHQQQVNTPSEQQTQSTSRRILIPQSINIMDEFGKQTDSIEIEPSKKISESEFGTNQLDESEKNAAVLVKNAHFAYTKNSDILSNICMSVPKGKIYALLGSSGCGKTTLLRIVLGRIQPRKGIVWVFGAKPGSIYSNIPGSGVGYMPQELALFGHFTIEETFFYYGSLHHMSKNEVRQKTDFMIELLNLPPKERQISQCSGGQQRRASIATTLFHDPPLLILDEPTVGVDPLLRCKIWQYLEFLCNNNGMTVIITTHYIEESRNAANLAFMRFGRILSQGSPEDLLQRYECTLLEDVFLKLCQHDCGEIKQRYSIKGRRSNSKHIAICDGEMKGIEPVRSKWYDATVDSSRLKALIFKNAINLKRNPLLVFFFLILPVIQIVLFCYSVLKVPNNLPVSIYNAETSAKGISKQFMNTLDKNVLSIKYYNSQEQAIQTVIDGKAWCAITIGKNFTKAYRRRAKNPSDLSDEVFEASKIKLYVDNSDNFMLLTISNSLMNSYQKFVEQVTESFGFNKETVRLPIDTEEIVYGIYNPGAGYDIMADLTPASLVAIIYTTPLILAAFMIVLERKGEIIERTFVSGATSVEVYLTHLITLMMALFIQVILLMLVAFGYFEIRNLGSLTETFMLLYLQGLCGILIGLLISSIAKNEIVALLLSFGLVFPIWMMCGVFWPLESVIQYVQDIFWCMPLSKPIRSIQLVVKRGWSYEHYQVQVGYYVSALYNSVLFVASIIIFHFTSK